MPKLFKRVLFGYNPAEVIHEMEKMKSEQNYEVYNLKTQIKEAQAQIQNKEEEIVELKNKLEEYTAKELMISEVLISAQRNAQRIEDAAREKARNMLEESEEKLKKKQQELENLRTKVTGFKEEFQIMLEKYQSSLDNVVVPPTEPFVPTLIISKKL